MSKGPVTKRSHTDDLGRQVDSGNLIGNPQGVARRQRQATGRRREMYWENTSDNVRLL